MDLTIEIVEDLDRMHYLLEITSLKKKVAAVAPGAEWSALRSGVSLAPVRISADFQG